MLLSNQQKYILEILKEFKYLFSVAWLDAATHIATVPRMKGERIIWISESGSFGEIDLPRHHFFAARQKDGTHRFFGSNEPEKI